MDSVWNKEKTLIFPSLGYAVFEDLDPLGVGFVGRRTLERRKKEEVGHLSYALTHSTDICH